MQESVNTMSEEDKEALNYHQFPLPGTAALDDYFFGKCTTKPSGRCLVCCFVASHIHQSLINTHRWFDFVIPSNDFIPSGGDDDELDYAFVVDVLPPEMEDVEERISILDAVADPVDADAATNESLWTSSVFLMQQHQQLQEPYNLLPDTLDEADLSLASHQVQDAEQVRCVSTV